MSDLMKIIQVGVELFDMDRQTDKQTFIVPLRDIAKAPKEWQFTAAQHIYCTNTVQTVQSATELYLQ